METPQIITASALDNRLVELINGSKKRILLEVMSFECNGEMEKITTALAQAALRGVDASVIYDRYSYFDAITKRGVKGYFDLRSSVEDLSEQKVRLIKVGGLHLNPFARRHHTKAFIIDDYALVGGGTNLTDDTFGHYDFMLEFHDPKIADALHEALPRIAVERNDAIIPIDKQSRFIVDGGRPGVSPILDTAVELAQGAEKIWYVSKMLPDPRLAEAILAVPGQYCYYGHMDKGGLFNRTTIRRDYARSPLHNLYDGDMTLHAKAIVVQYRDGSLRALTGSNNFNQRGVNWGTQEIALDTKDQSICTAVLGFIEGLPQKQLR